MAAFHKGGCQCAAVRFQVETEIGDVIACNCSRCGRLGSLLAFAPKDKFELLSGESDLSTYEFNRHVIKHKFCKICGIEPFAMAVNPKTGDDVVAINVRCIDGIDTGALTVKQVDGKNF